MKKQNRMPVRLLGAVLDLIGSLLCTLMNVVDIIRNWKINSPAFPQCDFRSYAKYDVEKHRLTHSEDRPFACFFPGCDYKAKQAKSVTDHQKTVHDPDRVKDKECTFCAEQFFTDHALSTHIKAHLDEKPYSCSYPNCNVRRVHRSSIKQHEITHRDEKNVHCDHPVCSYKTKNVTSLRNP